MTYWLKAESRRWQPVATEGKRAGFLTGSNQLCSHPESQTCTREWEQGCRQRLAGWEQQSRGLWSHTVANTSYFSGFLL